MTKKNDSIARPNSGDFSFDEVAKCLEVTLFFKEVHERIELLPEEQKLVLNLLYLETLSKEQVGSLCDMETEYVTDIHNRAMKVLMCGSLAQISQG